jgi:putative two-component system response regulator
MLIITNPIASDAVSADTTKLGNASQQIGSGHDLRSPEDCLKIENASLRAELDRRNQDSERMERAAILLLARLAEARDPDTGNHILRTQNYVRALAIRLREHPRFSSILTDRYIELLTRSAPLHDIGKVGVPDHILLKPGKLTDEEWIIMRKHTVLGSRVIDQAERDIEHSGPFLALAKEIAHWHHEKWDGSGYPDGLAGESIPPSARLMAVADVFDALISPRVYKTRISFAETRLIIASGRNSHFDPDIVDAFLQGFEEFVSIANQYSGNV